MRPRTPRWQRWKPLANFTPPLFYYLTAAMRATGVGLAAAGNLAALLLLAVAAERGAPAVARRGRSSSASGAGIGASSRAAEVIW